MDVLDAFHRRGQEAFEQIRDAPFHLRRQQAGIDPDHGGDGNRDIREDVGRHVENRLGPEEHDKNGHDDEGVGPAESNEDKLIHTSASCTSLDPVYPWKNRGPFFMTALAQNLTHR